MVKILFVNNTPKNLSACISIKFVRKIIKILLLMCLASVDSLADLTPEDVKISDAQRQFSTELLHTLAAVDYHKDVFFSPYSVYKTLLTMYISSVHHTEKLLENVLRFPKYNKPGKNYISKKFFHELRNGTEPYESISFDRIFLTQSKIFNVESKNIFKGNLTYLNTLEDEINQWISKYTKGMIKHMITRGTLKKNEAVILVNVGLFKGYWKIPLTGETIKGPFLLSDGTVAQKQFMSVKNQKFKSMTDKDLIAEVISLPFKGNDLSMIIILPTTKPKKKSTPPIAGVVKNLTSTKLHELTSQLYKQQMCSTTLSVPKFESEGTFELVPVLQKLGDQELFSTNLDLSNYGKNMKIDSFVHTAKVKVFEDGTEEAAATKLGLEKRSLSGCMTEFHADRPFIYIIHDQKNDFILFMGILNHPNH